MGKSILLLLLSISSLCFGQENQNVEVANIESGTYPVYKTIERSYNKYMFQLAKKPWPVELFTEGDNTPKILIKRVGIVDEFYTADLPAFPSYYFGGNAEINVSVINKKIYYYTWSAKSGATIDYILSHNEPATYVAEKQILDTYRKSIKNDQSGARDDRKEMNAELAAKEAEENTLEGKSIKSIKLKLVNAPAEIGMLTVVSVGVEVLLTNGKTLKTKNLGGLTPYTDFEASVLGGDYAGGDFKVANDSRQIPHDKIEIEIWSKFDKSVKGSFSHPINYKNNIYYQYQGAGGSFGRGAVVGKSIHGGHGKDGRNVNVAAEKMTINGENVTQVIITDALTGEVLAEAKVHANNKITLNVSGGNGGNGGQGAYSGDSGGNGGDGGNGGTVYLTGSGALQLNLIVLNSAGKAGAGGAGKESYNASGYSGTRGSNGSFIK